MARLKTGLIPGLACALLAAPALVAQTPQVPAKSTLHSGVFDDVLMIAADHEAGTLSGSYDDGTCRFVFGDKLAPTELYQRSDNGEAYLVQSWEPARPDRLFTTALYSRGRDGYQAMITLEPGRNDDNRPAACRWRITLDRATHVSSSFFGVRVVRTSRPTIFDIVPAGQSTRMIVKRQRPLRRGAGVWAARTSSPAYSPAGFVSINWYDPPGTPQGGYIRERDLYRLPPVAEDDD